MGSPVGRCTPCKLAGSVAASLPTTRSPGWNSETRAAQGRCEITPSASATSSLANRRSMQSDGGHTKAAPTRGARFSAKRFGSIQNDNLLRCVFRSFQGRGIGIGNGEGT